MFLVQLRIGQEEWQTTMVDNAYMESHLQVTVGTNYTQNTMDTPSKINFYKVECGQIVDYEGYDYQVKGGEIVDKRSTSAPLQVTIGANHTQNTTDTSFNKNYDQ